MGVDGVSRRNLLLYGGTGLFLSTSLSGCGSHSGASPESCSGSSELDKIVCRHDLFLNSAPSFITAGMLIGGAVGLGIAIATQVNPATAVLLALGAALLGGGVAAVDKYIEYRLKEANGDLNRATADIVRDMYHDAAFSGQAAADATTVSATIQRTVESKGGSLVAGANILKNARLARRRIHAVHTVLGKCHEIYVNCPGRGLPFDGLPSIDPPLNGIVKSNLVIAQRERDSARYLAEIPEDWS